MFTATLTTKGHITIPVDVRRALNIEAGDRVEFIQIQPGRFEVIATTHSVRGNSRADVASRNGLSRSRK